MNQLSIHSLLNLLLKKTDFSPLADEGDHTSQKITTSIRLEPKVRKFIDIQAQSLGFGLNEFISMTLKAVMESSLPDKHDELDSSFFRFIDVFKNHNIPLLDIPNFFDGKISCSDLNNKDSLLNKLDPSVIKKTSEMFSVEEKWLKGVQGISPYDSFNRRWYKNFDCLANRYFHYFFLGQSVEFIFLLDQKENVKSLNKSRKRDEDSHEIGITVGLKIENNNGITPYTFYEIWETKTWNHRKTRIYLKAILLFLRRGNLNFGACSLPTDKLKAVRSGNEFLTENRNNGLLGCGIRFEDYIIDDEYNPERDEFSDVEARYTDSPFQYFGELAKNRGKFKSRDEYNFVTSKGFMNAESLNWENLTSKE